VENVRSQCRRLQNGRVVYVAEVLVVIQYSVLVVRSGYTRSVCSGIKGSMYKVMRSFICRGCSNPVTSTSHTSVDIGASANLESVDKFCYVGDMVSVDGDLEMLMQLWRPESELDGINSGSWYHCMQIGIYH